MSDIVNEWLSVEAAAIRLKISSRSIARRIQSGQLESRVDDNGRRSVLVCVPAEESSVRPAAEAQPTPPPREAAIDTSQARELAQQALSVVIRTHEESALAARFEVLSAKRSARRAWAAVAILFIGASVTVGIVTHNLTAAAGIVRQAEQRVGQAEEQANKLASDRDQLRQQLVEAKVAAAEAQGRVSVMATELPVKQPTTAPGTAMQRFASALFGD